MNEIFEDIKNDTDLFFKTIYSDEDLIYSYEELQDLVLKYQKENRSIKHKVQKAIEYIEKFIPIDNDTILMRERQRDYLLDILKGSDKDEK